jgi:LysR family glycine cleavage system transcriptional activator
MRSLSRLKALQAFEAAARHGSFVGAGRELNVTPAAVGQMVRSLEDWLGAPLFRRRGSGSDRLVLLDDTREALAKLYTGLDALDAALRQLKARGTSGLVTATASQAIVAKWLLPRLGAFADRHPDVVVRLDVTDRVVDLIHGEADIAIRCGAGRWPGLDATHLGDEHIIVVCAPALLPESGVVGLDWLARQTLLHDTTPPALDVFPGWKEWAAQMSVSSLRTDLGVRINASAAIIQAAIAGQGVALARGALVAQDLAEGRLTQIFADGPLPIDWAYYAVASPQALARPPVKVFRDWLVASW